MFLCSDCGLTFIGDCYGEPDECPSCGVRFNAWRGIQMTLTICLKE